MISWGLSLPRQAEGKAVHRVVAAVVVAVALLIVAMVLLPARLHHLIPLSTIRPHKDNKPTPRRKHGLDGNYFRWNVSTGVGLCLMRWGLNQHTLLTHPNNTHSQFTLSTHPLNLPYQHTLSTNSILGTRIGSRSCRANQIYFQRGSEPQSQSPPARRG